MAVKKRNRKPVGKLFLVGMMFIMGVFLTSFISASGWCYQETANVSTACGGLNNGSYSTSGDAFSVTFPSSYGIDGNWSSYARTKNTTTTSYLYENWSVPVGALTTTKFQYKDYDTHTANYTVAGCWANTIRLRMTSYYNNTYGKYAQALDCWNGTDWSEMRQAISYNSYYIYEGAMFWDMEATPPTIAIQKPIPWVGIVKAPYNLSLNYTATDSSGLSYCKYSVDGGTNVSLPTCLNVSAITFSTNATVHTITVYANDTIGNTGSADATFRILLNNSESYSAIAYETTNQTFSINVTFDDTDYISSQGFLWYNDGTGWSSHLATRAGSNGNYAFSYTLGMPLVESEQNNTFFWQFADFSEGAESNFSSHNQTVEPLGGITFAGSCPAGENLSMFYNFKNEENRTAVTGVNVNYNFLISIDSLTYRTFMGNLSNTNNISVCINTSVSPNWTIGYGEIQYYKTGYTDRRWYAFNFTRMNNESLNNTLYLLEDGDSKSFLITARNPQLNPYEGKYISLMRWYPQIDDYNVVEMGKTSDAGQTVFKIEVEDVDYRMGLYESDGTLIYLANPVRMVCLASPCSYVMTVPDTANLEYDNLIAIEYELVFNDTTKTWIFSYNDPSQATDLMKIDVYRQSGATDALICSDNSTSWTGVLSCNVSAYNGLFKAIAYRTASPERPITIGYSDTTTTIFQNTLGLFVTLILMVFIALLGIASPIASILLGLVALIPAVFLHTITYPIAIAIAIVGGVVIHWMKKT